MSNSTATPLQGEQLLSTQFKFVTLTTVSGTLYGIAFILFCLYVHALSPRLRDGDRKRHDMFMLAYSTVIMLCGLYFLVANAWVTQDAFIVHRSYTGSPFSYEVSSSLSALVVHEVGLVCQVAVDALTLAIEIWRVWIIWSATRYADLVVVLPLLCFLTFAGLKLRGAVLEITLPPAELAQMDYKTDVVAHAVQGTTTILCTLLISLYLISKHWQQKKLIGKSQGSAGYVNIVAMMIESYALESVWLLTEAIIMNIPVGLLFCESLTYIEIIAYLLVQYRVARGNAYEAQKGQRFISSLRWNHSNRASTQVVMEANEIQGDPLASVIQEVPNTPRVSSMV